MPPSSTRSTASSMAASTSWVAAAISAAVGGSPRQVSLGQADTADVDRTGCLDRQWCRERTRSTRRRGRPRDRVRRYAVGRQTPGGSGERQGRLLLSRDDLGRYLLPPVLVESRLHPGDEVGRITGIARRRGGHEPHRRRTQLAALGGIVGRHPPECVSSLQGSMTPVRSTPYPSRTISIRRRRSVSEPSPVASTSATSRRIELVPQSIAPTRTCASRGASRALVRFRRLRPATEPVVHGRSLVRSFVALDDRA